MSEINATPSINPADEGSLAGVMRHVFGKLMQETNCMLPARVVAFNGDRNAPRVTVQPQVVILTTADEQISRAQIGSLPVFQFGAGGYMLSFPITVGDLGWIVAADRDISVFLQSFKESRPHTMRKNNFADAVFIPDIMRGYAVASEDAANAVLQNAAGTSRVAVAPQFVKISATQGLGVNTAPNANVVLDVAATTKAARPLPRMTQAQRDAIPSPQEGFGVWNLTTHAQSWYNGTSWS